MSIVNGNRITFKRTRPNPLFNDWLEELHEEAKQKGSKLEYMLKEALSSLSKYPLPLQSGAECAILKGFDKRLCLFLDKRLEVYKNSSNECILEPCSKSSVTYVSSDENDIELVIDSQTLESYNKPSVTYNTSPDINIHVPNNILSSRTVIQNGKKRKYEPEFRSGSYALLIALVDLKRNQSMSKGQLTISAQKYCENDISSEWMNMTKLIRKGLVNKSIKNSTPQFCLTNKGYSIAKELFSHVQMKTGVENKSTTEVNDLLYDENVCTSEVGVLSNTISKAITTISLLNDEIESKSQENDKNKCSSEVIVIDDTKSNLKNYDSSNTHVMPINGTTAILIENGTDYDVIENIDDYVDLNGLIEMEPGSFDIILLIDKNETSGLTKKNDPTVTQFNKYPELKHEYRSLKVGDFTWIARNKRNIHQELVLPYVVERKRMDDLGNSIKDGRFHEQKFRLRKCGLNHVIYMVENHGSNKHVGFPMQSLMQALANTRVQDGFKVHMTESLGHSVRFLATMTLRLMFEYKDKRLKGYNGDAKADILMTFGHFNKSSVKSRALSVTDTFIKLLLQLKGVSVEKALTITNVYRTPRLLIEKYNSCEQKEGEMLLANLKFGELNRSVGPSVSKAVYQLFTFRNMN